MTRLGLLAAGIGLAAVAAGAMPDGNSAAAATGAATTDAAAAATERQLRRDAEAVHAAGGTGVVATVRHADRRPVTARAGVADLDDDRPVPLNAYYRVGSDTKTFVAVVALQLVAEGRLDLDDTVERWLPGLVTGNGHDGSRVTVENLLRQTSGLPDYDELLFGDPETFTPEAYREARFREHTARELVDLALTQPPAWLPDADDPSAETRWQYSNTNYLLAGMIIERVTGHPWEQEVHERVIAPLGLTHTLTPGGSAYVPQPTATAYLQFPGQRELTDVSLSAGGTADGALISTGRDMTTFLTALMDGRLLPPEQLAAMKETVPAPDFLTPDTRYGLGIAWAPRCGDGEGLWFHGGTSFGVISETGVTDDGSAAATAAVFTLRFEDRQTQEAQDAATQRLVTNALC
ncbi:serine hydrolase domain-containing protein [Streptomyces sp. 4N509B]|uniref:serine hydrolase domain-containing protein n=1 Tax=Streptomyces sp. 4N509B TaxID=3457413 RepID=UPI003FD07204